jgi:hypothetical protein
VALELRRNERRFFVGGGSLLHGTESWMSGRYDGWARFCNRGGRRIRTAAWRIGTSSTYKVPRCNAAPLLLWCIVWRRGAYIRNAIRASGCVPPANQSVRRRRRGGFGFSAAILSANSR